MSRISPLLFHKHGMSDAIEHPLFHKHGMSEVIEHQKHELRKAVEGLSRAELEKDHSKLAKALAAKFTIKVPVLLEGQIEVTEDESQVDGSGDPMQSMPDPSRPFYVPGLRVTVHVPFEGDGWMFDVQPDASPSNPPRGQVQGVELLLIKEVSAERQAALKTEINQDLASVRKCLECLAPSAQELGSELKQIASQEISKRQQQLASQTELISSLGFPRRTKRPKK